MLKQLTNNKLGQPLVKCHILILRRVIGIPVITKMPISVPHPIIQTVVQPYPVAVFIPKPVPYQVIVHITIRILQ